MTLLQSTPDNLERQLVVPQAVYIEDEQVIIVLSNEEKVMTPLILHPWLATASAEQQANYEMSGSSIDWPALDEGLDIGWIQSYQNSQLARADST